MSSAADAGLTIVPAPTRPDPSTSVLAIDGPVAGDEIPRLCARLRTMLSGTDADVVVDVHALAADLATIDALARLQLTARLLGRRIGLRRASPDLDRLVSFAGLAEILPTAPTSLAGSAQPPSTATDVA